MGVILDATNEHDDPETLARAMDLEYVHNSENFQPWLAHGDAAKEEQRIFHDILRRRAGMTSIGANSFVSTKAHVYTDYFAVGENSWIAAGAIIRGHVDIGSNSSVNPFAHIAGKVTVGNGVRIAGMASIYGFNHGTSRVDIPIYRQQTTARGVVIGDGTWVGANAVVIDGVSVGAHCVVAGGAVVTRDVPDYAIVAGNPAKVVRIRKAESAPDAAKPKPTLKIRKLLYSEDPYENLAFSYPPDLQGWDSTHPVFSEVISALKPNLIVEVGTWKGASALHMAEVCNKLALETEIVCIDTWLGNWQHWSRATGGVGSRDDLKIVNGLPRLYYQFMSNVIDRGKQDSVTPLPLTGVAGAKLFEHFKIRPQLVYIDGDHEYESVVFDLRLWLKLLSPGGVLIGDDYSWAGVAKAVDQIMTEERVELKTYGQKFTLKRN